MTDFLEQVTCPLCHGSEYRVIYTAAYPPSVSQADLLRVYSSSSEQRLMDQLVHCKTCSFDYLNPRVKTDIILASYRDAQDKTHLEQSAPRIATFRRSLLWLLDRLKIKASVDVKILDVGSAGGYFLRAAKDLGCTATGVEPSVWLSEAGRREFQVDLRTGTLGDHAFPPGHFSLVTLWDVLEHVPDPAVVLDQIRPLLSAKGYLIINYPDYGSWIARLLGKRWPFLLSVHLYYFTRATIGKLLEAHGYRVLFFKPYFQTLQSVYVVQRASAVLPWMAPIKKILSLCHLDKVPVRYYIGQTLLVAVKT